jgi:predicted N-acetyltransferase YhbS
MLFDQFESGPRYLDAYINSTDPAFTALVQGRGYRPIPSHDRPLAAYAIPNPFPTIELPEGFSLKSLAEETDWARVHQVLWRGFDNQGDPPAGEEELESRRKMFETPNANLDLKIVVQAPNGDFAALCGMWYEPTNHYAYVEPVATDPTYRRLGLGRAAVLEGIRRCGERGATVAYVGSDQPFYLSFGFEVIYNSRCWQRNWE